MRLRLLCTLLLAAVATPSVAQELRLLLPTGGSRGQQVKVVCYGTFLKDVQSVVWLREGIEVEKIQAGRADRVTLHLRIPENCEFGSYMFALHTARGLTRMKAFRVGPLPSIRERKNHGTRELAQRIALNLTVDGRILAEEVDWYAFEAEAGEVVRAEVEAVRLGISDIDPQLEIFGPDGKLLQRRDDSSLGKADPLARFTAKQTGTHWLALRDVAYRGSSLGAYRLHVGTFPRPIGLLPAGGRPGETISVQLLGDGEPAQTTITLPTEHGLHWVFPVVNGSACPTPVVVAVDERSNFIEGATPKEPPAPPCAFHGVIKTAGAEDRYAFHATKGRRVPVRALARALRSRLDPVLIIRDAKGKALTSNDDGIGLDGRVNFTPPATGTFFACVRDHLRQGSDAHFYRIEIGNSGSFSGAAEAVPGRRSEYFGIAVPQGRRNATMIRINGADARKNPTLRYENLPTGVQANAIDVNPTMFVPVVFSATANAGMQRSLGTPALHYKKDNKPQAIRHMHRFPVLRVRNNEIYESRVARALPIVVTKPVPFDVETKQPRVPIVRSGSMALPVTVTREKGFTGTVRVRVLALPAGVSASTLTLTGKKTTGNMSFNANSRAAVGDWPIVLVASTVLDGVTCTISTEVFTLPVHEPWVTATVPRARIEQGQKGTLEVVLDHKRKFDGKVTAVLGRIPKGVTYKIPAIQPGMNKLPVAIDVASTA
ncbi:MAG: hypothetical protein ACI9S9_002148, partial [Planctomycetota bacterium]